MAKTTKPKKKKLSKEEEKMLLTCREVLEKERSGILLILTPESVGGAGFWPNFDTKSKTIMLRGLTIELMTRYNVSNEDIRRTVDLIDAEVEQYKKTKRNGK